MIQNLFFSVYWYSKCLVFLLERCWIWEFLLLGYKLSAFLKHSRLGEVRRALRLVDKQLLSLVLFIWLFILIFIVIADGRGNSLRPSSRLLLGLSWYLFCAVFHLFVIVRPQSARSTPQFVQLLLLIFGTAYCRGLSLLI